MDSRFPAGGRLSLVVRSRCMKNISEELIEQCRKGERRAQYTMYRALYPALMSVCFRYERNAEDAAALMNGGFLKVLDSLKTYDLKVSFEAWSKRIMINHVIDEYRRNRKRKETELLLDGQAGANDYQVATDGVQEWMNSELLRTMLHRLPELPRKVFNLFAIDGYSHKEIAELLNMPVGTSRWHLAEARRELQKLLLAHENALISYTDGRAR